MPRSRYFWIYLVLPAVLIFCSYNIKWGKERWKTILEFDSFGYYVYLPAVFIYQDLHFGFIETIVQKYHHNQVTNKFEFRQAVNGKSLNKYYCGTALAQLPFFGLAHFLSGAFHLEKDGYAKIYLVFINLAAIFYLMLGLFYLRRLLLILNLPEWKLAFLMTATVFGTPLFYYTVIEPGMSHVYSFAFVTMFLYYSRQFFLSPKNRYVLILALLLGLITLIRPVNALAILLVFFTAGSFENLKRGFYFLLSRPGILLSGLAIFLLLITQQLLIYKISTGQWWVYSYGNEGFHFLNPHFIDILFSYRKGLFLYTPLFFISLAGAYFLWFKSRYQFFSLISFLFFLTYILSSWWSWWYGGSFSGRPFLEFSALFIFLLALALKELRNPVLAKSYLALIVFLTLVCQFQTYQYRKGYIHYEEMTKDQYWNVFLNPRKLLK